MSESESSALQALFTPSASESRKPAFPLFQGLAEFIFDGALYAKYSFEDEQPLPLFASPGNVDGHCIYCNERSTFHRVHTPTRYNSLKVIEKGMYYSVWGCTREKSHKITLVIAFQEDHFFKIGQYPSLADIANDAAREFKAVLKGIDRNELSKAIGLAAHSVGVGSYVYMRRVFERLIERKKQTSGIKDEDFAGKRMSEKINLLRDHLPDFLVENKGIYGILSKGIHELGEEECLAFYPVIYESIVIILEEDRRRAEIEERKKRLSGAIRTFGSQDKDT